MATVALEIQHRIDHVLDHLGTGDLAILGDVADQQHAGAALLGKTDQGFRPGFQLRDAAGCGLDRRRPQRLDRIDDGDGGRLVLAQRGQNVGNVGFSGQQHRGIIESQPLGAQPYLGDGLFARDINDALTFAGKCRQGLQQQRRFADAGVTADQHPGTWYKTAARNPVELANASDDAGRCRTFAPQAHQPRGAALRQAGPLGARQRCRRLFLDNRVPGVASIAFARPLVGNSTTGLTDKVRGFGHGPCLMEQTKNASAV